MPSKPKTKKQQFPKFNPEGDIRDYPLPTYYWPYDFIRYPLGARPRGQEPEGGYILERDNHARWETNAYHYLIDDGSRPVYDLGDLQTIIDGPRSPALREKVEGWLDVDSARIVLDYELVPDEASEKYYPKDGFSTIFRNQLKRWLQFRAWQASNRDYHAAKARRHAEFVDQHIQDTDRSRSLLNFGEQKKLGKQEYDRLVKEEKYKGTQKAVQEKHLLELFKDNFVWDTLSPEEWMKMANEVFENEIEHPSYREVLKLAGIDYVEDIGLEIPKAAHSDKAGSYTWGFDYIRADLAEVLERNIRIDMEMKDYHLPLRYVNFQRDPWRQHFFSTWVEYVYYECRTLEVLDDCLGLGGPAREFESHADKVAPLLRPGDSIDSIVTAEHRDARQAALISKGQAVNNADFSYALAKKQKKGKLEVQRLLGELKQAKEEYSRQWSYMEGIGRFLRSTQRYREIKQAVARQTKVRNWAVEEMFQMIAMCDDGLLDLAQIIRKPTSPKPMDFLRNSHSWNWGNKDTQEKKKRKGAQESSVATPRKSRRLAGEEPEFQQLPESPRKRGKKHGKDEVPSPPVTPDRPWAWNMEEYGNEEEGLEQAHISRTSIASDRATGAPVPQWGKEARLKSRSESISRGSRYATNTALQWEKETRVRTGSSSSFSDDLNDLREAANRRARETARAKVQAVKSSAALEDPLAGLSNHQAAAAPIGKRKRKRGRPSKKFRMANPRIPV